MLNAAGAAIDQATGLRRLFRSNTIRVLPILQGEASAWLAALLARGLAAEGERVLILDQSSSDIAAQFGRARLGSLSDLLAGAAFQSVATQLDERINALALQDGLQRLAEHGYPATRFFRAFALMEEPSDLVLVHATDVHGVARFLNAESECDFLIASGAEEGALAAAYRCLKRAACAHRRFQLVLTGEADLSRAIEAYRRIAQTAERFLGLVPAFGGHVPAQSIGNESAQASRTSPQSSRICAPSNRTAQASVIKRLATQAGQWRLAEYTAAPIRTPSSALFARSLH